MKRFIATTGLVLFLTAFLLQCGKEKMAPVPVSQKKQLELLPAASIAVGYINFQSFTKSPFRDLLKENHYRRKHNSKDYDEFIKATGIDPEKDVKEAYFALAPRLNDHEANGLVVLHGNFDVEKIRAFIRNKDEKKEVKTENYGQYQLFIPGEKKFGFAFADEHFLVGGNLQLVKAWLDRKDGKDTSTSDLTGLKKSIQRVKYKDGMWMAVSTKSLMDRLMKKLENRSDIPSIPAMRTLRQAHFSLSPGEELKFEGEGSFTDKENSKLFGDALKGVIATAKLAMGGDRNVIDIINKVKVGRHDNTVSVHFSLKKDEIKQLLNKKREIVSR